MPVNAGIRAKRSVKIAMPIFSKYAALLDFETIKEGDTEISAEIDSSIGAILDTVISADISYFIHLANVRNLDQI